MKVKSYETEPSQRQYVSPEFTSEKWHNNWYVHLEHKAHEVGFAPFYLLSFSLSGKFKQFIANYSEINITRLIAHSENKTKATYMVLL